MRRFSCGISAMMLFVLAGADSARAGEAARWDFDVYLNDKKIGTHVFEVVEHDGEHTVQSEATFKYRILFIPAYRYEHHNTERWEDGCLVEFAAQTNANGKQLEVSGELAGDGFRVRKDGMPVELPRCVMSFAYWDPEFLEQSRLLNPQTGEYVDVSVRKAGYETLQVRGESVPARRFRLTAYEVDLTLWYSHDDEWLALESVARGGYVIRYELS
jgi:hypothetical protein